MISSNDHLLHKLRSISDVRNLSAGKNSGTTTFNDIFQCFIGIGSPVKGPMKGNFHRISKIHQSVAVVFINLAIFQQHPENNSFKTQLFAQLYVLLHYGKLIFCIKKISTPWPNNREDGNSQFAFYLC